MVAGLSSGCLRTVGLKVPFVHGRIQPRNGGCSFDRDLNLIPKILGVMGLTCSACISPGCLSVSRVMRGWVGEVLHTYGHVCSH